jgi:hypothetical protein
MNSKKSNNQIIIYGIIIASFITILFFALGHEKLVYDFTKGNSYTNIKIYNSTINNSQKGLEFNSINDTGVIFDTNLDLQKIKWQQYPYIKLKVKPENFVRNIALFWSPTKSLKNIYQRVITIDEDTSEIIINTSNNAPWLRNFPWKDNIYGNTQINSFGLLIPQQYQKFFTLEKIELFSNLSLVDYTKLFFNEITTDEGIRVNSINAQYGISLFGMQLSYILGVIIVLSALPLLVVFNQKSLNVFLVSLLLSFVIYNVAPIITLINHAKDSTKISAFYQDKYEEYKSRFGKNFADLAKEFEEKIPKNSKVHFASSKDYRVRGESNWISFQYYGLYDITSLKEAEYIFYYHPKDLVFNKNNNMLEHNNDRYSVKIIAKDEDNYILQKVN